MLSAPAGCSPDAERWVFWYLVLTPLWWALGLIVPLGTVGIVWLFVMRPRTDPSVTAVCWLWFSVTAAQSLSAVINWSFSDELAGELARSLTSFSSTGWILLGMCFGVGCSYRLAASRLVRAVCFQALWILVLSALGYAVFAIGGNSRLEMPSLLAMAVPSLGEPGKINFVMRFFLQEDFMGDSMFRLVLFFPWSTGLALAGLLTILLAFQERSFIWRLIALAGGMTGFVLSYSRAVFAASVVAGAVIVMLRSDIRTRLWLIVGAGMLANLALLMDSARRRESPTSITSSPRPGPVRPKLVTSFIARPGRALCNHRGSATAGSVKPTPAGCRSTSARTRFLRGALPWRSDNLLGGLLGLTATLWLCLSRLWSGGQAAPQAFALLLVYGITSYGENMQTLVPSLLVSFVWIGGEMATQASQPRSEALRLQIKAGAPLAPVAGSMAEHAALRFSGDGFAHSCSRPAEGFERHAAALADTGSGLEERRPRRLARRGNLAGFPGALVPGLGDEIAARISVGPGRLNELRHWKFRC